MDVPSISVNQNGKFVIAVDLGTTNLKCSLYSKNMELMRKRSLQMKLLHLPNGCIEIDPNTLWNSFVLIVRETLAEAGVSAGEASCCGISCQRGTFIMWDRNTNEPFHNLITWKDLRAHNEVSKWNESILFKILKFCCYCLYLLTNSPKFLTVSLMKFTTSQVTMRLMWVLKNNQKLIEAMQNGNAMFGTLDTWLLYRLTHGKSFVCDRSCASSTGMYDPFNLSWANELKWFGISNSIFPNVCDTAGTHFGNVSSDIWGSEIPITCCIADQAAALFGSRCSKEGDMNITLGTGAFFNVNVGAKVTASKTGLYPLIVWKYQNNQNFVLECGFNDCGTNIDWARSVGLFENVEDLSRLLKSVENTNGVYFVSSSSGLQSPIDGNSAGAGFIGIKPNTEKEHLIKAVVESIVFRVYDLYSMHCSDLPFRKFGIRSSLCINGGVANNDFICQSIADICCINVVRRSCVDMSIKGVALLAGHAAGLWNADDIDESVDLIFYPNEINTLALRARYTEWTKCQLRFRKLWQ